jgi:hypothetical protein
MALQPRRPKLIHSDDLSAPVQDIKNRIVGGPVPTLTVTNSKIKGNKQGVRASFYNRLVNICSYKKLHSWIKLQDCFFTINKFNFTTVLIQLTLGKLITE